VSGPAGVVTATGTGRAPRGVCTKPLEHKGRCRDDHGASWENNHPVTEREQRAVELAARMVEERDLAVRDRDALAASFDVLAALHTLVRLHRDTDEWGPAEHDAADAACDILAPLVGETADPGRLTGTYGEEKTP